MSHLMTDVYWQFGQKKYASYDEFVAATTAYNKKIDAKKSKWKPDKKVAEGPITVTFEAGWKDDDDVIEVVIGDDDALTMGRILFELNNATLEFFSEDEGSFFFEGLSGEDGEYDLLIGT